MRFRFGVAAPVDIIARMEPTSTNEPTNEPTKEPKVKAVLEAARSVIEREKNWHKGGAFCVDADGVQRDISDALRACPDDWTFCLVGAVRYAAGDDRIARPACDMIARALGESGAGAFFTRLSVWNDAPERTHAEVLAAIDAAIAAAGGAS